MASSAPSSSSSFWSSPIFGVPKVVGGQYNVLPTDIYKQVIGQQNFTGAVVGLIALLAVAAFVIDRSSSGSRPPSCRRAPCHRPDGPSGDRQAVPRDRSADLGRHPGHSRVAPPLPPGFGLPASLFLCYDFDRMDGGGGRYRNSLVRRAWSGARSTVIFSCAYLPKARLRHRPTSSAALLPSPCRGCCSGLPHFLLQQSNPLHFILDDGHSRPRTIAHFYSAHLTSVTAPDRPEFRLGSSLRAVLTFAKVTLPVARRRCSTLPSTCS
jgi:iron(III) transport system permease protein